MTQTGVDLRQTFSHPNLTFAEWTAKFRSYLEMDPESELGEWGIAATDDERQAELLTRAMLESALAWPCCSLSNVPCDCIVHEKFISRRTHYASRIC